MFSVRSQAMAKRKPEGVTLKTVHEDLKAGFSDLKVTLITGFQSLPTRESSEEMIRLLRENNRVQEQRFTQLDVRIREQHLELQQALRTMAEEIRNLSTDIKALIARIDALIKGRGDGSPRS